MRKIEAKVVGAFVNHKAAALDNTSTDGESLYLHGHKIAEWGTFCDKPTVRFSLAGWDTRTTCSRLNAMLTLLGANRRVWHKNWEPRFGDALIYSDDWYWV